MSTEDIRNYLQFLQINATIAPGSDYDRFLPNPFQFILPIVRLLQRRKTPARDRHMRLAGVGLPAVCTGDGNTQSVWRNHSV